VKSQLGRDASKYTEILDRPSYSVVAAEYYDEQLHPTCADFRLASRIYLERLFAKEKVAGRVADIGCGRSLLSEMIRSDVELILVDESDKMLAHNDRHQNVYETRKLDLQTTPFGRSEFAWVFAILADPYNTAQTWKNIYQALQDDGQCIFITPSLAWAQKFRTSDIGERPGFARFIMADGAEIFLPSLIFTAAEQERMLKDAGLHEVETDHVLVESLPYVKSRKISEFLSKKDAIIDVYRAKRSTPLKK
jgi:SAM-dependent methyltransferase